MTYTRDQLIDALDAEYQQLCHDSDDSDMSPADYRVALQSMPLDQLIAETCTDELYTLDAFMHTYGV